MRKLRSAVEKIEKEISDLEASIAEKETMLASGDATIAADATFYAEYQSLKDKLEERMSAWEDATIALEEFEGK